jgi:hypothetical protein
MSSVILEYGEQIEATLSLGEGHEYDQMILNRILAQEGVAPRKDLDRFYELVKLLFETLIAHEGTNNTFLFGREYPMLNQQTWNEIITFKTLERLPGRFSRGGPEDKVSVRRWSPHLVRPDIPDPTQPGHVKHIYEMNYENRIQLTCWALSPAEADARAFWVEEQMFLFGWFFQVNGIDKIIYRGRKEDIQKFDKPGEAMRHFGVPLIYQVHTTRLSVETEKILERLHLVLRAHTQAQDSQ